MNSIQKFIKEATDTQITAMKNGEFVTDEPVLIDDGNVKGYAKIKSYTDRTVTVQMDAGFEHTTDAANVNALIEPEVDFNGRTAKRGI